MILVQIHMYGKLEVVVTALQKDLVGLRAQRSPTGLIN